MSDAEAPILEAVGVSKHIPLYGRRRGQVVRAIESADLHLRRGQIRALVGESGSGKTTLARLLALGDKPTSGEIRFQGNAVSAGRRADRLAHFGQVQLVLQDPFSSLNNLHRVRYILSRPLRNFGRADKSTLEARILELLERVHLSPAREFIDKFPHELSGGQRQRVAIARALAVEPSVILGDEPVSMLDVSIRLDILNLFAELRDRDGLAMLYITHDIASARYFSDEIDVMYAAHLVEGGPAEAVTQDAKHPYTRLLLDSSTDPDRLTTDPDAGADTRGPAVDGDAPGPGSDGSVLAEPPDIVTPPPGCPFQPRCPKAMAACSTRKPPRHDFGDGHWTRCWLYEPAPPG